MGKDILEMRILAIELKKEQKKYREFKEKSKTSKSETFRDYWGKCAKEQRKIVIEKRNVLKDAKKERLCKPYSLYNIFNPFNDF